MNRVVQEAENRLKMTIPKKIPLPLSTGQSNTSVGFDTGGEGFRLEGYDTNTNTRKRKAIRNCPIEKAFKQGVREQLHYEIAHNLITRYVPPGYNLLSTTLLQKERANVERLLEPAKNSWKEKGLSIVIDGWTDLRRRPLINFMVASEAGAMFLKAVNYEVYDVTRRETFTNLSDIWAKEVDLYSTNQDCIKMLVGNKVDKENERVVTKKEGIAFARECGCLFLECSAKTRVNVEQCFEELVLKVLDTPSLLAEGSTGVRRNIFKQKPPQPQNDAATSGCC